MKQEEHSLFDLLILSLGNAALIALGIIPDPETNKIIKNLSVASYNIELLEMLKLKTKNNLNQQELNLLQSLIYDLQLKYVEGQKHS